ncbi:MAG: GNAT family N-acetyltransferase [Flavobacteriaceae bacterium]|nr:GNAT family N-acetyltransferase [Flavobacteriaceae bacterium]
MNITTFPILNTERLILRKIEESDSEVILFLRSDKTINKFIERPENRKIKNISDAMAYIKKINQETKNKISFSWGITLKNDPKIIGTICLWNFSENYKIAEVGYDLNPVFQRKGIMSEALIRVVDFGFNELNLDNIEAYTDVENEKSKKLLAKNGFILVKDKSDKDKASNVVFEIKNLGAQN